MDTNSIHLSVPPGNKYSSSYANDIGNVFTLVGWNERWVKPFCSDTLDYKLTCSAVHSALLVGLDRAKISMPL